MSTPIEPTNPASKVTIDKESSNKPITVDYFNPSQGWGKPIVVFYGREQEGFRISVWSIDPSSNNIKVRISSRDTELEMLPAEDYLLHEMGANGRPDEIKPINISWDLRNGMYEIHHNSKLPNDEQGIMFLQWNAKPIHLYIERVNRSNDSNHVKLAIKGPIERKPNTSPENKLELYLSYSQ